MTQPHAHSRTRPGAAGITPSARLMDRLGAWVVGVGGISVIAVVLGIFVFVVRESYPLFVAPSAAALKEIDLPGEAGALAVGVDPYQTVMYSVSQEGLTFLRLDSNEQIPFPPLRALEGRRIVGTGEARDGLLGLALDDGSLLVVRISYRLTYPEGERVVTPEIEQVALAPVDPLGHPLDLLAYRNYGNGLALAAALTQSGRLLAVTFRGTRSLLGPAKVTSTVYDLTDETEGRIRAVAVDGPGRTLLAGNHQGELFRWEVVAANIRPRRAQRFQATERPGLAVTSLAFLLGDVSLVVGDAEGNLTTWFPVRQAGRSDVHPYRLVHTLRSHDASVVLISPSMRDKQFLTADTDGVAMLHHLTSEQTFFRFEHTGPVRALAMAPKADGILVVDGASVATHYALDNPHPETTLKTLFGKVWYEGYENPEFVWQSTGGTDEFEPKLSIVPLAFGTAKGTLYAMLFALPLAVLAALYTSEFARPEIRNVVKPTVELMASLPSVILGFLAGLWLAPLLESGAVGALLLFPVVPAAIVVGAWVWSRMPRSVVDLLPDRGELYLLVPATVLACWAALALGPTVEHLFFGGDFQTWLRESTSTRYDQRNCVVVGFAMGFAVVPIIYTICEDALSSVPGHLRAGSLALGATPWQTAVRVVLPTASPGIFSATMIGFGRAVGETMVVLMATGNTPILDWTIFNGMRTLSANIAVEIPEAPHEGTLYRVLFLTGLLLTGVTFVVNTVAEVVRQRLRNRYGRI